MAIKTLIAISTTLAILLPLGFMLFFVVQPDAAFYRRGLGEPRVSITREEGLAYFLPLLATIAFVIGLWLWRGLRQTRSGSPVAAPQLPLCEIVLWIGRQGWRSLQLPQVAVLFFAAAVPLGFIWWIWSMVVVEGNLIRK